MFVRLSPTAEGVEAYVDGQRTDFEGLGEAVMQRGLTLNPVATEANLGATMRVYLTLDPGVPAEFLFDRVMPALQAFKHIGLIAEDAAR